MPNDTMELQAANSRRVICSTGHRIWFLQQKHCKGNKRMEQKARMLGKDVVSHGHHSSGRMAVRSQDTQVAQSLEGATDKNQGPLEGLWTQKSTAKWLWSRVDE